MSYQKPLNYAELLDDTTEIISLVSIVFAGRVFYWASRAITLLSDEVGPIQYEGGLSIDWTDAISLFNDSPPLVSISLELSFPEGVNVPELVAKGHDLTRATGEFSLLPLLGEARRYEDRVVVFSGKVTTPTYGAKGEPVAFSLEANPFEDTALIPTAPEIVNLTTWPDHDPAVTDRYYPIVFGSPGVYTSATGTSETAPGSPGLAVVKPSLANPKILIAGHRVAASQVSIWYIDGSGALAGPFPRDVERTTDALGHEVSLIPVLPYAGATDGTKFWISWERLPPPATDGVGTGGLINDHYDGTRTGAGEVMTYFFRRSTLDIDTGRWRAVESYLDQRFKLSGFIDEPVQPWDYIKQNILPLLPVSLIATGQGLAPVVWRRDASKAEAVGHLTAGGNLSRVGPVNYERQNIENEIRFTFAPRADENLHERTAAVLGERSEIAGYFSTEYSRSSFLRYGANATNLESDIVFENATANQILEWKHRASCFPYRVIKYTAAIRYGFLRRGDLVLLTDPELYLERYLAFLRAVEWKNGRPILTLVLIDDPPREDR